MKIVNKTKFSNTLIKKIMKAAGVKAEPAKTLVIGLNKRYKNLDGHFIGYNNKPKYLIHLREHCIITLAHEIRHLAQVQRVEWWGNTTNEEKELDAEFFERWLEDDSNFL